MAKPLNVLLLAFEFPPLGGVGVQRSLKLAKYLPDAGVNPIVVTPDVASLEAWFGKAKEQDLLKELPSDVKIERVPCPRPRPPSANRLVRWVGQMTSSGEEIGRQWEPELTARWDALVREHDAKAVYVSVPPFSMAPLVVRLARRSELPLVLDFRDNWSQWCCSPKPSWFHYAHVVAEERVCVEQAAAVIGVTGQLIRDLQAIHPHVPATKFHVIPNGYDAELTEPKQRAPGGAARPFVIGYVGSFYYTPKNRGAVMNPWWQRSPHRWLQYAPRKEDWLYRSPYFFLRTMAVLLARRPELRSLVKVRFAGERPEWLDAQIIEFGLADVVEHLGWLSHRDCLAFQSCCDALLSTSAKIIGGRDYCIAGKTFEYITIGAPIVAFVTDGEQRDFLRHSGGAVLCDPDSISDAAARLESLIDGTSAPPLNASFLQTFHRRHIASSVAAVLAVATAHTSVEPAVLSKG